MGASAALARSARHALASAPPSSKESSLVLGLPDHCRAVRASGLFLWLAQREIPIGTSYAVWTGIGAAGTFLVGVLFYGDAATPGRLLGLALIVAGVATLRLAH